MIGFVHACLTRALNGPTRTVYEHKFLAGFCAEVRFLDMRTGVSTMRNEEKKEKEKEEGQNYELKSTTYTCNEYTIREERCSHG